MRRLVVLATLAVSSAVAQPPVNPPFALEGVVPLPALGAVIGPACDGYSDEPPCYGAYESPDRLGGGYEPERLRTGAYYGPDPYGEPETTLWAWTPTAEPLGYPEGVPDDVQATTYRDAERWDWGRPGRRIALVRVAPGRAVTVRLAPTQAAIDSALARVDLDALRAVAGRPAYAVPVTREVFWSRDDAEQQADALGPAQRRLVPPSRLSAALEDARSVLEDEGVSTEVTTKYESYDEDQEDDVAAADATTARLVARGPGPGGAVLTLTSLDAEPGRARAVLAPPGDGYFGPPRERTTVRGHPALVGDDFFLEMGPSSGPARPRDEPRPAPFVRTIVLVGDAVRVTVAGSDSVLAARLLDLVDLEAIADLEVETLTLRRSGRDRAPFPYRGAHAVGGRTVRVPTQRGTFFDLEVPRDHGVASPLDAGCRQEARRVEGVDYEPFPIAVAAVSERPLDPCELALAAPARGPEGWGPFAVVLDLGDRASFPADSVAASRPLLDRLVPTWAGQVTAPGGALLTSGGAIATAVRVLEVGDRTVGVVGTPAVVDAVAAGIRPSPPESDPSSW